MSTHVMMTKGSSLLRKARHYFKSLSWRQKGVMTSKRLYIFTKCLKVCLPLPIGQPKQSPPLFFKQTSYLIPLLAAISKPVLCHPILQLDQCPTYFWFNATPPPSSGLVQSSSLFIMIRFVYHRGCISTIYLEEVPPHTHTRMTRSYKIT